MCPAGRWSRIVRAFAHWCTVTPVSHTPLPALPSQNAFPVSYRLVGVKHVGLENEWHALQVVKALVNEVGDEIVRHLAKLDQLDVVLQEIESRGVWCDGECSML